jgi:hypothetical protein
MGNVEDAVRREIQGNSALAELAYKLAREIDLDAGGVAAVRELRAILNAYKQTQRTISPFSSPRVDPDDQDEEEGALALLEPPEGATWIIDGKKLQAVGGHSEFHPPFARLAAFVHQP